MLHYPMIFLLVAVILSIIGFTGNTGMTSWIARILFIGFLVMFVHALVFGRRRDVSR